MLLTVVTGAVDVAGGAGLNADVLALQIIRRSDIGTILNDDDLNALCVGIREIYILLTIRGNGHASQRHVDGVALQRRDQGIELHIGDLELHAQLVSDSSSDVRIDALYVAVVANELVRREVALVPMRSVPPSAEVEWWNPVRHCWNQRSWSRRSRSAA
mgnify:CR=1 FL=1